MHARTPAHAVRFLRLREAVKSLVQRLTMAAALAAIVVVAKPYLYTPDPRIMLASVVVVTAGDGSGSGVVVWAGKGYSFILTNHHVIGKRRPIMVVGQRYGASGALIDEIDVKASVIRSLKNEDLALLRVEHEFPTATLALKTPPPFTPIYAVGAQRQLRPIPTPGIVMTIKPDFMISAPGAPGSSGGASFALIDGDYRLVGVPNAIRNTTLVAHTVRGPVRTIYGDVVMVNQVLPHLVYVVPIESIRLFLAGLKEFNGIVDSVRPTSDQ